jgi:hypothetical protein
MRAACITFSSPSAKPNCMLESNSK